MDLETRLRVYRAFWEQEEDTVLELARFLRDAFARGGRLFVAGNGGSAAQADHFVAELVGRFREKRNARSAVLLGAGFATLTALSNDFGYDRALAFELEALARPGDVLLVLTTSGQSANIRELLSTARRLRVLTIALTGERGRGLEADRVVAVPSTATPLIQEVHLQILHTLAERLEGAS